MSTQERPVPDVIGHATQPIAAGAVGRVRLY